MTGRFRILILGGTLFASAFLLFICQPMVGKMLLPYLGGAAAVWTTCVLFFQVMLLLGYVYAHLLSRVDSPWKQMRIHVLVLLLPFSFLPIRFKAPSTDALSAHPSVELLLLLTASVAVPFFVVSTTAPLLQNWFSQTGHEASHDPYFLYSASNAGSLLALLVYPFALEPRIGVTGQARFWTAGYVSFLLLLMAAITMLYSRRNKVQPAETNSPPKLGGEPSEARRGGSPHPLSETGRSGTTRARQSCDCRATPPNLGGELKPSPTAQQRCFWLAAAFVPSGLMLAVTNHIAENVGSVPFLWILPLALYLLTFIFAFARRFRASSARISRLTPVVLLGVFPLVAAGVVAPPGLNWVVISLHLVLLFCGALLCHTRLAESRPEPIYLTEFYFWVALGGVLGGVFTATLSPLVFNTVLEYPLIVAVLPFFRIGRPERSILTIPIILGAGLLLTWLIFRSTHLDSDTNAVALVHTAVLFVAYKLRNHVKQFAWSFAIFIMAYAFILPGYIEGANRTYATRNFFGVKKVLDDPVTHLRKFLHGDTIHGIESTDRERAGRPLSYYYPGGSVSDVIEMMRTRNKTQHFGVLGLGTGTMAAYADMEHRVTFFEIDPSVEPIARRFFTFLPRCGTNCDVVVGDGRLQLERMPDGTFDLLLLDAFSSDSVPTHLLSREAVHLYLRKLAPDGVLLFHVSNRYLNVEKLVAALISDAGLVGYSRFDDAGSLRNIGKSSANHVVATRHAEHLGGISTRPGWERILPPSDFQTWTDDYSNLLSLIRWH